jgi:hypothetical protein
MRRILKVNLVSESNYVRRNTFIEKLVSLGNAQLTLSADSGNWAYIFWARFWGQVWIVKDYYEKDWAKG